VEFETAHNGYTTKIFS